MGGFKTIKNPQTRLDAEIKKYILRGTDFNFSVTEKKFPYKFPHIKKAYILTKESNLPSEMTLNFIEKKDFYQRML